MTDGIIQQLRRKYNSSNPRTDLGQKIVQRYLDSYTQELIEKIKQELDYDKNCHCYHCDNTRKLIGDNE